MAQFFVETDNLIVNIYPRTAKTTLKTTKFENLHYQIIKIFLKFTVNKGVVMKQGETNRRVEQNREFRNRSTHTYRST